MNSAKHRRRTGVQVKTDNFVDCRGALSNLISTGVLLLTFPSDSDVGASTDRRRKWPTVHPRETSRLDVTLQLQPADECFCRNLRAFTVAQKLADDLMSLGPALRISAVDTDGRCAV